MKTPTPDQFFAWVQKHAKRQALVVVRHIAYYSPDGLLLELTTIFDGHDRLTFDGEELFAGYDTERLIECEVQALADLRAREAGR